MLWIGWARSSIGAPACYVQPFDPNTNGYEMINGVYGGATALDIYSRQQEMIAKNLAHLNTPGYRRQELSIQENTQIENGIVSSLPGATVGGNTTNFAEGIRDVTNRKLDVAISGDAFFVFQGESENVYSRDGRLFRDPGNGQLKNIDGMTLLSDGQPVVVPPEISLRQLVIDKDGGISAKGESLGEINTVRFDNNQLLNSENQTYFGIGRATEIPADDAILVQGSRELSQLPGSNGINQSHCQFQELRGSPACDPHDFRYRPTEHSSLTL